MRTIQTSFSYPPRVTSEESSIIIDESRVQAVIGFLPLQRQTPHVTQIGSQPIGNAYRRAHKLWMEIQLYLAKRKLCFFNLVRSIWRRKFNYRYPELKLVLNQFKKSKLTIYEFLNSYCESGNIEGKLTWQEVINRIDFSEFRQSFFGTPNGCSKYLDQLLLDDETPVGRFDRKCQRFSFTQSCRKRCNVFACSYSDLKRIHYLEHMDILTDVAAKAPLGKFKTLMTTLSDERLLKYLFQSYLKSTIGRSESKYFTSVNRLMTCLRFGKVKPYFKPLRRLHNNLLMHGKVAFRGVLAKTQTTDLYEESETVSYCGSWSSSQEGFSYEESFW